MTPAEFLRRNPGALELVELLDAVADVVEACEDEMISVESLHLRIDDLITAYDRLQRAPRSQRVYHHNH